MNSSELVNNTNCQDMDKKPLPPSSIPPTTISKCTPTPPSSNSEPPFRSKQDGQGGSRLKAFAKGGNRRESPSSSQVRFPNRGQPSASSIVQTFIDSSCHPPKGQAAEKKLSRAQVRAKKKGAPAPPASTSRPQTNPFQIAEDREHELGSLQAPGSKKQNLNHLLNFHFTPRESRSDISLSSASGVSYNFRRSNNNAGIPKKKINREQFLQSNCQFLINSTGTPKPNIYKTDPDVMVEWERVEQVLIRSVGGTPSCPICLQPPVAAKITRCGHIYCWPCLIHYMSLTSGDWRKCPICDDFICKRDYRSVVVAECHYFQPGNDVNFLLVHRDRNFYISEPFVGNHNISTPELDALYARLRVVSTTEIMEQIIQREEDELTMYAEAEKGGSELCYIETALKHLTTRKVTTLQRELIDSPDNVGLLQGISEFECQPSQLLSLEEASAAAKSSFKARNDSVGSDSSGNIESNSDEEAFRRGKPFRNGDFFFYQASDGQNLFLHPMNIAMLRKVLPIQPWLWPETLSFKILETETIVMTEDVRKRFKYLRHLPIYSTFQLVEVDLSCFVSQEVYEQFAIKIDERKKRRTLRLNEETRLQQIHEEKEMFGFLVPSSNTPPPQIESTSEFPYYFSRATLEIPEIAMGLTEFGGEGESVDAAAVADLNDNTQGRPSVSFAQIVSQAPGGLTSPVQGAQGVWGLRVSSASGVLVAGAENNAGDEYAAPEYRNSVSDAIARAFADVVSVAGEDAEGAAVEVNNAGGNGRKKGKKKSKGKLLFDTSMW